MCARIQPFKYENTGPTQHREKNSGNQKTSSNVGNKKTSNFELQLQSLHKIKD